ncbi:DUF6624 domain-containing protein [Shewanella algae]
MDQSARKQLGEAGWDRAPKNLHTKLSTVDHENTKKLSTTNSTTKTPSIS